MDTCWPNKTLVQMWNLLWEFLPCLHCVSKKSIDCRILLMGINRQISSKSYIQLLERARLLWVNKQMLQHQRIFLWDVLQNDGENSIFDVLWEWKGYEENNIFKYTKVLIRRVARVQESDSFWAKNIFTRGMHAWFEGNSTGLIA